MKLLNTHTSEYYLSLFELSRFKVTKNRIGGHYKGDLLVSRICDFNDPEVHWSTDKFVFSQLIKTPEINFLLEVPVLNQQVPDKCIKIVIDVLSNLVKLDQQALKILNIPAQLNAIYITEKDIAFDYVPDFNGGCEMSIVYSDDGELFCEGYC
jgi:hypothetical protein